MRLDARKVAWLLPFLLTGCFFKKPPQPAPPLAPALNASNKPDPPALEHPHPDVIIPSEPLAAADAAKLDRVKPRRRRKQPPAVASEPPAAPAATTPEQAATPSPAVSAIGQLSSGGSNDVRQQTVDSIAATERGLNSIGRTLDAQEQQTAGQIREFLRQAKVALVSGDIEGAHTLAAKAGVLLGELTR
jgi:hypothetical protein